MSNLWKFMSRKFIMLFLVFLAANFHIYLGNISGWVWFATMMVVGISYPLFNVMEEKIRLGVSDVNIVSTVNNAVKEIKEILPNIKSGEEE